MVNIIVTVLLFCLAGFMTVEAYRRSNWKWALFVGLGCIFFIISGMFIK